jgi:hypothetical protein
MNNQLPMGQRVMDVAYINNGTIIYTGESVLLACLLHATGKRGRKSKDMLDLQELMLDRNLESPTTRKK